MSAFLSRHLGREFRKRQLGHVPFAVERETREDLVMAEHRPGVLDAFGLHGAEPEIAEVVVVGGGDRKLQPPH